MTTPAHAATDHPVEDPRVAAWEQRTEWPLVIAALVFFGAYAWPILEPGLHGFWRVACHVVDLVTWVMFAADYLGRVVLANHRMHYVLHHLLDLLVVALPIFRPLRLLRLLLLIKLLNRQAAASFRGRVAVYVSGLTVVLLVCASLAVLDSERGHPGANIETFGQALWWSFVTVSTVGYGDFYPVTTSGRIVAVALMIGGVALIGVVTATLASWLIDRVRSVEPARQTDEVADLRTEIAALRGELRELREWLPRPSNS